MGRIEVLKSEWDALVAENESLKHELANLKQGTSFRKEYVAEEPNEEQTTYKRRKK